MTTKILIAQLFFGRGINDANGDESKGVFTLEQVEASIAAYNEAEGVTDTIKTLVGGDCELDGLFFGDGHLSNFFEPNWCEDSAKGFAGVLRKVLAGKTVLIDSDETLHGLALDTGDASRKTLMADLRAKWHEGDPDGDADDWVE